MAEQVTGNTVPQRVSLHRNFALKDYCIIAGLTLISLPLGFYFGIFVRWMRIMRRKGKWKVCAEGYDVYHWTPGSRWRLFHCPRKYTEAHSGWISWSRKAFIPYKLFSVLFVVRWKRSVVEQTGDGTSDLKHVFLTKHALSAIDKASTSLRRAVAPRKHPLNFLKVSLGPMFNGQYNTTLQYFAPGAMIDSFPKSEWAHSQASHTSDSSQCKCPESH